MDQPQANASIADLAADRRGLPLCVDLDGTLIRSDTLVEGIGQLVGRWQSWAGLGAALLRGRAALKRQVAETASLDAALLPYEERVLDLILDARRAGRRVVLVTAADQRIARAVADHLELFDEVMASDGTRNLKGAAKGKALAERFGEKGFIYAGNDSSDLSVWRHAAAAILVNASPSLAERARRVLPVEAVLPRSGGAAKAMVKALRPYQWVKNLLVFVPIVTAHALGDWDAWGRAALAAMAFSLVASSIYIVNDLSDLDSDRRHARKRRRPFASGAAPIQAAFVLVPVLLVLGGLLGTAAGVVPVLIAYAAVSLGYSMWLKQYPLVDMFALAVLYTIRLYAGGEATGYAVSLWLLAFSSFFFLGLAAVKRAAEILPLANAGEGKSSLTRRGYVAGDGPFVLTMGTASSFIATMVLALYVQSDWQGGSDASAKFFWLVIPLILFWQCRLWLATTRGQMDDDPIIFAAKDWVSRIVGACIFVVFVIADGSLARLLRGLF